MSADGSDIYPDPCVGTVLKSVNWPYSYKSLAGGISQHSWPCWHKVPCSLNPSFVLTLEYNPQVLKENVTACPLLNG